jgi:oxygen-independent coproporphyrinogen III oxidase
VSAVGAVRHLYVHVPFCAHRCGYCDFVTLVGRSEQHGAYVDALLGELELELGLLAEPLETLFLGGGTPTFLPVRQLERLLGALPAAGEVTVEANPETVTPELARSLREAGVTRVSLGAQSLQPHLLAVLERRARPADVRRAFYALRDANFDNISLDLIYGIPSQSPTDLERDLAEALALGPEHISCYELEAKPGTRFTHAHGAELQTQAEAMEGYFEQVVDTLVIAGYRWYETSNFCRDGHVSRHNLAYWQGRDYLGIGIGAVSTVGMERWRNTPKLGAYLASIACGDRPLREVDLLDAWTRERERLMLGLRLDEPLELAGVTSAVDHAALARLEALELAERTNGSVRLTRRGRFVGGAATAELMAEMPAKTTIAS